ncbi:unnamed protein product [Effrenium voratum]|nr:unnamed protein product [Effrenium voratum]
MQQAKRINEGTSALAEPSFAASESQTAGLDMLLGESTGDAAPSPDVPSVEVPDLTKLLGAGAIGVGLVALFKFTLAGLGGLFVLRGLDQKFGQDGRKTQKTLEKFLKRLAGETDLLEERNLKVQRLNDQVTSFQAALAEQLDGPAAAESLRSSARRRRFAHLWDHILAGLILTPEERQKVEAAVEKYAEKEKERQENFADAREKWLNNLLENSFWKGVQSKREVAGSMEQKLRLQEELMGAIREAVTAGPDAEEKNENLKKALAKTDLSWLTDGPLESERSTVYVLSFDGDPSAAGVKLLSQEITAILESKTRPKEVVLKLKSPGGTVTGYGLAAAELLRLRQHQVPLVVCVDELAASGGYMMACCGDRILCSPFAAVGSIGVISGVPNAAERLDREGLKVIQTTAGKWKRTLDPFQAPTPEAIQKAEEDVQLIYRQFSSFVKSNRPHMDLGTTATGEVWFGQEALDRGLVDELQTSSEYLMQHMRKGMEVLSLTYSAKPKGLAGLAMADVAQAAQAVQALQGLGAKTDLAQTAELMAGLSKDGWPATLPEPRVEARGPFLGGNYGF